MEESLVNLKTIFINIPSYHDPEIWETINNFYQNAKYPERVYFGVTNQTNAKELHEEVLQRFPNVKMDIIEPGSIIGCQPARLNSHKFYNNQDYYLNMDSHMRSIKNWDEQIIDDFEKLQEREGPAVLTCYATPYDKDENGIDIINDVDYATAFYMSESNVNNFLITGIPQFCAYHYAEEFEKLSPYISGHFFFTSRQAILDAPFVKEVMFTEEEIFMSIRFYTAGYKVFNPNKTYVYHRYGRGGRPLFWEDFPDLWYSNDLKSREFVNNVLVNNIINKNSGLLEKRSLEDFENQFGISFKERKLSKEIITGNGVMPLYDKYKEIPKTVAIVTAFSDIGRGNWDGWPQRTTDQYFEYFSKIAHLENPIYIYIDDNLKEKVLELRHNRPTYFINADIYNDFNYLYKNIKKIHSLDSFKNYIPEHLKEHPEYWSSEYVFITLLKSYFVKLAIDQFQINEDLLSWIDFGYKRENSFIGKYLSLPFNKDKITVFSQKEIVEPDIVACVINNDIYIIGSSIVASKENWLILNNYCDISIKELFSKNIIDDDQSIWLMSYLKNKDIFDVIVTEEWFALFKYNVSHIFNLESLS